MNPIDPNDAQYIFRFQATGIGHKLRLRDVEGVSRDLRLVKGEGCQSPTVAEYQ